MIDQTGATWQLKEEIMDKYFQLGMEQGFSKVLLDQVASELSISKKTIYKIFTSKEHIISSCIDSVFEKIDAEVLPIMTNSSISILDKIKLLPEIVANQLDFFTRHQVVEIQRSFPDLWTKVLEQRKIRIERYEGLFQAAKSKGYINDIDSKMIVQFFLVAIEAFTKESFMIEHNMSYSQSLEIVTKILLEGILNKIND
ncbi:TetR/AcrR family transcriptional regulator [Paenibacillus endoradicis]|uniref:TetR/AcrR family transcriptional regulator n=1 Tax=Paenibacillus endoradicis TaxID=2972487 RepID=UPI0021592E13|nr:TetR/AcrR family transcriptional regulator [Paenibacillus endoradicis]MCR8657747.1 TetR/AcrR family transcriptional regulator [Paenibacillus endoradicis]